MGGIWLSRNELITSISEIFGYKSGLAVSKRRLLYHVPVEERRIFHGPEAGIVRIRSEEYEQLVADVLFGLGNIRTPRWAPFGGRQYHRYKTDPASLNVYANILTLFHLQLAAALQNSGHFSEDETQEPILFHNGMELAQEWTVLSLMIHREEAEGIDVQSILGQSEQAFGNLGVEIATDLIEDFYEQRHRNPWGTYRREEWKDVADLENLFKSESLQTQYGRFFD
jgi:restriction system protein